MGNKLSRFLLGQTSRNHLIGNNLMNFEKSEIIDQPTDILCLQKSHGKTYLTLLVFANKTLASDGSSSPK